MERVYVIKKPNIWRIITPNSLKKYVKNKDTEQLVLERSRILADINRRKYKIVISKSLMNLPE